MPVKRSNSWIDPLQDFGDMDDIEFVGKEKDKLRTTFYYDGRD
jgi:hypothetical protein